MLSSVPLAAREPNKNLFSTLSVFSYVPHTPQPVPVSARFAAARLLRLCVRIPPEAWTFVCCECCVLQVEVSAMKYHSPRGVLPTVVRRCVWSRNLVNEKALAHWGTVPPKHNPQSLYNNLMQQYEISHYRCVSLLLTKGRGYVPYCCM